MCRRCPDNTALVVPTSLLPLGHTEVTFSQHFTYFNFWRPTESTNDLLDLCIDLLVTAAFVPHPRRTHLVGDGKRRLHQMQAFDVVGLGPHTGVDIPLLRLVHLGPRLDALTP